MRISMLLHKSVVHDSRVRREASALATAGHEVIVLELADVPPDQRRLDGFARRSIRPTSTLARELPYNAFRALSLLAFVRGIRRLRPDVVHAHDAAMLLPGLVGARLVGARLVYDSHELATGVPYRERAWARLVAAIESLGVPRSTAVITVSDGIARELARRYALDRPPVVVRNACELSGSPPAGTLRRRLEIDDEPLVLHLGAAARDRGCEVLIRGFARLDAGHLVLLGAGGGDLEPELASLARAERVSDRVHILPPVPLEELIAYTADADVGVSLLQDTCENHRQALPNKVFQYLAAGVPIVASELPELRRLVGGLGVGWLADPADPEAVAEALRGALAHRDDPELAGRIAVAAGELSWDREQRRLLDLYGGLADG